MNTIFIYINGILTKPAQAENWNGKAVTWTHLHTPHRAEKIEYYVGPISRVLGQKKRSAKLVKTLRFYDRDDWRIVLVGHSNGGDVICDALKDSARSVYERITAIHLIAPANEADFDKNGLNAVGAPVVVYIGTRDSALKIGSSVGRFLGYGSLGKDGPKNARLPDVRTVFEDYGHSEWFTADNIDRTLQQITGHSA